MTCSNPLVLYKGRDGKMTKNPSKAINPQSPGVLIPCGHCMACRLDTARRWSYRCMFEASAYEHNSFITLTFDSAKFPDDHPKESLSKEWMKSYLKRFREAIRYEYGVTIRYYLCGEYGDNHQRPHYHAIIFGFDFPDKKLWSRRRGNIVYRSAFLEKIWPYGFSTIGSVTVDSCGYVARYVTKKITGDMAKDHYGDREPEFQLMSLRPGIGYSWFEKFWSDVYPQDLVLIKKRNKVYKDKPPRIFDQWMEKKDKDLIMQVRLERSIEGLKRMFEKDWAFKIGPFTNIDLSQIARDMKVPTEVLKDSVKTLHRHLEKDMVKFSGP